MIIPFTQFLRPDGRRMPVSIDTQEGPETFSEEADELVQKLLDAGCKFEIEQLTTGMINMDCQTKSSELLAQELCENGPAVIEAIQKLVLAAHLQLEIGHDIYGESLS